MIEINIENDGVDFSEIERILVIKLQHLGDVLLTTPIYKTVKEQFPHINIDVLIYQETKEVLLGNTDLDNIFTIDRKWKKKGLYYQCQKEVELFKQLKAQKYNLILNLTDRWRGAWLTRMLQPTNSVSLPYQHRRGKLWRNSFSHIYRVPQQPRHTVEKNLDALRRLGIQPSSNQKRLTFNVSDDYLEKMRRYFKENKLGSRQIVVIHPTSRWMFKAWTKEGFSQLLALLVSNNFDVIMISGPAEIEVQYAQSILTMPHKQVFDLSGQLSIQETAAVIKLADCLIGLDSVAIHLSAAVSTPCVALFGPTFDQVWYPWSVEHKIVKENVSCRPCGLKGCGDSMASQCLQSIKPDVVFEAVQTLLNYPKQ